MHVPPHSTNPEQTGWPVVFDVVLSAAASASLPRLALDAVSPSSPHPSQSQYQYLRRLMRDFTADAMHV